MFQKKLLIIVIPCLTLGVGIGWWLGHTTTDTSIPPQMGVDVRGVDAKTTLINPLLECADIISISNKKINAIRNLVSNYISEAESTSRVSTAAVYFRDLNNGPWFGINEKEDFVPGSLLKVPLMISVYKEAMVNPSILKKELLFTGIEDYKQNISPPTQITPGKKYTVSEMVEYMIRYSDNDAADTLFRSLNQRQLVESYTDLGIKPPEDNQYTVSVRTYASFFRILYNATYLNHAFSQKSLELLSQSSFNQGIVAGVPATVSVAHKFGERELINIKQKQLHDCGIVYFPGTPYILCVMTKGSDFTSLEKVSADISRIIYNNLSNKN